MHSARARRSPGRNAPISPGFAMADDFPAWDANRTAGPTRTETPQCRTKPAPSPEAYGPRWTVRRAVWSSDQRLSLNGLVLGAEARRRRESEVVEVDGIGHSALRSALETRAEEIESCFTTSSNMESGLRLVIAMISSVTNTSSPSAQSAAAMPADVGALTLNSSQPRH